MGWQRNIKQEDIEEYIHKNNTSAFDMATRKRQINTSRD